MTQIPVPEGTIAKRPMHFFWLVDHSGSMEGRKMATLNQAIREALPELRRAVAAYPEVAIVMRAIKFSNDARWHVGPDAVPVEEFVWPELEAHGETAMARAVRMLAGELTLEKMPRRGYPPVCVLISDGFCTDPLPEYHDAIAELDRLPWGKKAVRLAIAVGQESEYDKNELLRFVSHKEINVLKADTPEKLVAFIKWASVTASVSVSHSRSRGSTSVEETNVVLTAPPDVPAITSSTDAF